MTTRTDLLEIIRNGENSGVEFKRDGTDAEKLARELVAFSNLEGGILLLGVEDDGNVSGISQQGLEETVMNICRDRIRPEVIPYFEVIRNVKNGKDVAVVKVTRGYDVHALRKNNSNQYLIRVGSTSREASPEELARLFQQRGSIRAEMRPISGATFSDLNQRRLQNYFRDIREQDTPNEGATDEWKNLLVNTDIMTEEGITVGGMLLFGNSPNRFLNHAGIDAVAYTGTEQDYDAQERKTLRGPMTPLLNKAGEIVDNGLVEQAMSFIQRNTHTKSELDGGRRREFSTYPVTALRESIVNALIHRDYLLTGTDIQLEIYCDRLEVVSPGRLPNGITPTRMLAGTRVTRNQLIQDVMRDYRYLEHMGMGIPRKIVKGMKDHNGTEPELVEQDERFTIRLLA